MVKVLLSVIVPVFGVENYVERCVRSLFEQTFQAGVEFIFVDDCTPDSSIEIIKTVLKEYPSRSAQVKFLRHEQNKGLPYARKTGLLAAQGEYILNVDSDDWIEPDTLAALYSIARNENADIVVFDWFYSNGKTNVASHQIVPPDTDGDSFFLRMVRSDNLWALWNKMFRRSLYLTPEPIVFPSEHMAEDMVQSAQLVERAHVISYLPECLYHYFINPVSHSVEKEKVLSNFNLMSENVELLISLRGEKNSEAVNDWLRMKAKIMLYPLVDHPGGRSEYLRNYSYLNRRILFNRVAPLRSRMRHLAVVLGANKIINKLVKVRNKI